jgi:hypothetical protein
VRGGVRVRRFPYGPLTASLGGMGVITSIESASVTAEPGATTSCTVRVRNTGMVVDQVLLDILGDAKAWTTVEPDRLNLLPGTDAQAQVVFRPPRSSAVLAGPVPFAIRAMSSEDPDSSSIEEGAVEVGRFSDVRAVLAPGTARGPRKARYQLIVENQGNTPTQATVSVSDPDLLLEFRVKPRNLVTQPGTATYVRLRTAPKKRFLRGPDRTLPFQVLVQAEDCAPVTVNGVMIQEQIMPGWLLPAIAIVIAAGTALVVLWFTVLKPQVQSMATEAVNSQMQQMNKSAANADQAANQANQAAQKASQAAQSANSAAGGTAGGGTSGGTKTGGKTGTKTVGTKTGAGKGGKGSKGGKGGSTNGGTLGTGSTAVIPVSSLLQSNAAPAATFSTVAYAIAARQTLDVSDIVLENPLGDTGLLQIRAGSTVLFVFGLANFRSIDYHFVQPLAFTHSVPLVLAVECQNPGGGKACTAGLSFSGTLHK